VVNQARLGLSCSQIGQSRDGSGSQILLKISAFTSHHHTTIDALYHQAGYMFRPLEGVRVLDLSRVLAGPYTAKLLSDLGATVLRVEAPWGDDTRGWGPPFTEIENEQVAAYWTSVNLGKSVIRKNLKIENDLEDVRGLISDSDVIIENFRPGKSEEWFRPWPENAIVCSISAYGNDGPRSREGGYDIVMQARSGLMSITGDENGNTAKVGVAVIDVATGLHASSAILAALYRREKEGIGARLTLSLWDCALDLLVNQAQNAIISEINPTTMGTSHPNLVPYRAYATLDGEFVIAVGSDEQWIKLVEALGLEIPEDSNWSKNAQRVEDRVLVDDLISKSVIEFTSSELEAILDGIPCAPVNSIKKALSDPHSIERGMLDSTAGINHVSSPHRFHS